MQLFYTEQLNESQVNELLDELAGFARPKSYDCNNIRRDILEISKSDIFWLITGLSASIRIVVTVKHEKTYVYFLDYQKEYIIKAVLVFVLLSTGILSIFFLIPIYGAFRQYKLIEDIKSKINDYFNSIP